MKKFLILLIMIFVLVPSNCMALNEVNIYFFHNDNCDICKQEEVYLKALQERYSNIRLYSYETSKQENYDLMLEAREMFNDTRKGVPFTVIADTPYHGFNEASKGSMQNAVYKASNNKYENKLGQKLNISYKDDLEGEVKEYKENSSYKIEEPGEEGTHPDYKEKDSTFKKYQASIVLVGIGIVLAIIYLFVKLLERRGRL